MSETETNAKGKKPKVSKLAIASPLVIVSGFFMTLVFAGWINRNEFFASIGIWTFILSLPAGLITGIIAYQRICKSKGLLTGRIFSILGTILALSLIVGELIPTSHPVREYALQAVCSVHLRSLGTAMRTYASNYDNKYPTADKWCDLLLQHTKVSENLFVCRGPFKKDGQKRCTYAINPNAEPNSPSDMVLLFETKDSWNQIGGPEILNTENHKGKGCCVLFNDGHVEFVNTERLGHLKWKVE